MLELLHLAGDGRGVDAQTFGQVAEAEALRLDQELVEDRGSGPVDVQPASARSLAWTRTWFMTRATESRARSISPVVIRPPWCQVVIYIRRVPEPRVSLSPVCP